MTFFKKLTQAVVANLRKAADNPTSMQQLLAHRFRQNTAKAGVNANGNGNKNAARFFTRALKDLVPKNGELPPTSMQALWAQQLRRRNGR